MGLSLPGSSSPSRRASFAHGTQAGLTAPPGSPSCTPSPPEWGETQDAGAGRALGGASGSKRPATLRGVGGGRGCRIPATATCDVLPGRGFEGRLGLPSTLSFVQQEAGSPSRALRVFSSLGLQSTPLTSTCRTNCDRPLERLSQETTTACTEVGAAVSSPLLGGWQKRGEQVSEPQVTGSSGTGLSSRGLETARLNRQQ